jgi:hypothetical protein
MSHHYSGPGVSSPHGDARLDLSDLYAFPKPGSAALGPKAVACALGRWTGAREPLPCMRRSSPGD